MPLQIHQFILVQTVGGKPREHGQFDKGVPVRQSYVIAVDL